MPELHAARLVDEEVERERDLQSKQIELGFEQGALAIFRGRELAAAELFGERGHIQPAKPCGSIADKGEHGIQARFEADAAAEAEIDVAAFDLYEYIAEIPAAHLDAAQQRAHFELGKIGRIAAHDGGCVERDDPLHGSAVHRERKLKVDGTAQHGRECRTEALRRRKFAALGRTRRGLCGIFTEIFFVDVRLRLGRIVLIDGDGGRRAPRGDPRHLGGIRLADLRLQDLPCGIEGIGDRDRIEARLRNAAREDHLVDIVGGRHITCGIEVVRLREGAVFVGDDGIGCEQRLLVDDIHGERRGGKSVFRLKLIEIHVAVGIAVAPLRIDTVIGILSALGKAPKHAVPHIAELPRPRGTDGGIGRGDIRHDEHAVIELLVSFDVLIDRDAERHALDGAVHLQIPIFLLHEAGVHVADVFERVAQICRGIIGGRGAVRRKRVGNGDEALRHLVARGLLKKDGVHAEYAEAEHCRNAKTRQRLGDAAVIFGFEANAAPFFTESARALFVLDLVKSLLDMLLFGFHIPPMRHVPHL